MPITTKQRIQEHLADPVSQAYIANRIAQIDKQVRNKVMNKELNKQKHIEIACDVVSECIHMYPDATDRIIHAITQGLGKYANDLASERTMMYQLWQFMPEKEKQKVRKAFTGMDFPEAIERMDKYVKR